MCARFKFTVPDQFTKGQQSLFESTAKEIEARPGSVVPAITPRGTCFIGIWDGFARIETLNKTWLSKGWKPVKIVNGTSFKERDTVSGTKELKTFNMKKGQEIGAIARVTYDGMGKKYVEIKMVTQPAEGNVKSVHHRMPKLIG